VEKGIKRMSATIYDAAAGSKQAADALAAIGLSAQQLQGMSPEDQFTAIMEGLAGIDDASQRAAVAQKLLGRAGTELLPMVNNLEEARERARELGLVMSDEAAQKAADFSDALNEIKSAAKGVALAIGESLAETMTTVLDFGTSMITNWKETWNLVKNSALFSLSEVWEGMKHGLTVAAPAYLNWFGENWFNLWTDYSNFVLTVISNMAKGIGDIFSRIWEFITSGFEGGFGDLFSDIGEIAGRDLLEGFEATTQSLPDIPERQLKPYQQALQKEMEKSATIIAEGAAKRRQMTAGGGDAGGDITGTASEAAAAMAKVSVSAAGGFSVGAGQFAGNESIKIQQEQLNYLEMIANNTGQINNPGGPAFGS
jgi:hypothetical protein